MTKTNDPDALGAFAPESECKSSNDCGNSNPRRRKIGISFCSSRINLDFGLYVQGAKPERTEPVDNNRKNTGD